MAMNYVVGRIALASLFWLVACDKPQASNGPANASATTAPAQPVQYHLNRAQPKLRTVKVWLGPKEVEAELAVTLTEISTGMMFRTNMPDNTGMLFVFAGPRQREFYMKNCLVSISAAYIDTEGAIAEFVELHPGVEKPVPSKSHQIQYVLEMPKGWFERNQISTGTVINTSQGPLKNLRGILP